MTDRRVTVTGAAGHLGRHVVRRLAESGWTVTGLVRETDDTSVVDGLLDRVVRGAAHDPETAASAVEGVDAVVHLAAIPTPTLAPAHVVFGDNTLATFCVLDAAAEAGVPVAVLASSISATGLPFSPHGARPPYLPIDEDMPTQAADPYALAKTTDELTAAMISRRSGVTTTALRLPFLGTPDDRLGERAAELADDPEGGARDVWAYLDSRDAALAIELALGRTGGDSVVVGLAAPETMVPYPTEQLLDAFLPGVPRRTAFPGRRVAVDLTRADEILGFTAQHPWPVVERDLPGELRRRAAR